MLLLKKCHLLLQKCIQVQRFQIESHLFSLLLHNRVGCPGTDKLAHTYECCRIDKLPKRLFFLLIIQAWIKWINCKTKNYSITSHKCAIDEGEENSKHDHEFLTATLFTIEFSNTDFFWFFLHIRNTIGLLILLLVFFHVNFDIILVKEIHFCGYLLGVNLFVRVDCIVELLVLWIHAPWFYSLFNKFFKPESLVLNLHTLTLINWREL